MRVVARLLVVLLVWMPPVWAESLINGVSNIRGINIGATVSEQDLNALASYGIKFVRLNLSRMPIRSKTEPYQIDNKALENVDRIVEISKKLGIMIVLDPHTTPGTKRSEFIKPDDEFWDDEKWQDMVVETWKVLVDRYKNESTIIAYDLLNEPTVRNVNAMSGLSSWNALCQRIVDAVRSVDKHKIIFVEPAAGRINYIKWVDRIRGVNYFVLPKGEGLVLSVHMYLPTEFTHQGVGGRKLGFKYPGFVNGEYYDKDMLRNILLGVKIYSEKNKVPVVVSEFSASRYGGADAERYIGDLLSIFNEFNWGWIYHSFRLAPEWDAEMNESGVRAHDAERMNLLLKYVK